MFSCASCGHTQALPEQLLGREAKCPQCGQHGKVVRPPQPEPGVDDVKLDDLVEAEPPKAVSATPAESPGALAVDAGPRLETTMGHLRHFFSGNLLVNFFSGIVGGGYELLVCMALAMLALTVNTAAGLTPHALVLTLVPAVLGSVFFALHGRLPVALGGPDPAATVSVFLLLGVLSADLLGHVSGATLTATLVAGLTLSVLLSGAFGVLLSRFGLAERVRFLPSEVLGGMLAGFGLLLVKAWLEVMAQVDPALAALTVLPLVEVPNALASASHIWGPAVGFGAAYFLVQMTLGGLIWPLLLATLTIGVWNLLAVFPHLVPGLTTGPLSGLAVLAAAQPGLPPMLDLSALPGLFQAQHLAHIDWPALASRADFFAAAVVVAILPSLMRTPILESVLERDSDPDKQMCMVGASSLLSGLAGALPSSLSLSGSLGLRALGAAGPLAGFTVGLACLGFLLAGQPILQHIPTFVPLGILLAMGLVMPVSWLLRDARNPLSRKDDNRAAWTSCLMVAFLGPVLGVFATLGLGAMLSLARAVSGGGVRFTQSGDVYHSNVDRSPAERRTLRERGGQILVLRLQGFLFLGTLYDLWRIVANRLASQSLRYVLLDFGAVTGLGASASTGFRRLETLARQRGLLLYLTSVPLELEEHLEGLGYRMDDSGGVCRVALNLDYALEFCEDAILAGVAAEAGDGLQEQHQTTLEELLAATFPDPRLVPALMKCLERVEVPRKHRLMQQGEASDCMYFLQSGKVQVELALPGGKLLRLKKMGPGTVFGEMGIYTNAPRSASVIATERCVAFKLSVERFTLIQQKAPQLAAAVNRFIVTLLAERVAEENAKNRAAQM